VSRIGAGQDYSRMRGWVSDVFLHVNMYKKVAMGCSIVPYAYLRGHVLLVSSCPLALLAVR